MKIANDVTTGHHPNTQIMTLGLFLNIFVRCFNDYDYDYDAVTVDFTFLSAQHRLSVLKTLVTSSKLTSSA